MALPALSFKARALRLLAQREHSRAELERKLQRHLPQAPRGDGAVAETDPDTLAEQRARAAAQLQRVLDELAAEGLLSEARAAASVVRRGLPRFGERRLRQDLKARGLDPALAATELAAARSGELERARAVWQQRYGELAPDAAGRARQARFLAGRGFSTEVILRVVKGLAGGDG